METKDMDLCVGHKDSIYDKVDDYILGYLHCWDMLDIDLFSQDNNADRNILDHGCGLGNPAELLNIILGDGKVVGVDTNAGRIALAHKNTKEVDYRITARLGLPCQTNEFNGVFSAFVFPTIYGKQDDKLRNIVECTRAVQLIVLKEIYRVLKPNGVFILSIFNRYGIERHLPVNIFRFIVQRMGIGWGNLGDTTFRLYGKLGFDHVYSYFEAKKELRKAGFKNIKLKTKLFSWYLIFVCKKEI